MYSKLPPGRGDPALASRRNRKSQGTFLTVCQNDRTGGVLAAESHTSHVVALRLL